VEWFSVPTRVGIERLGVSEGLFPSVAQDHSLPFASNHPDSKKERLFLPQGGG